MVFESIVVDLLNRYLGDFVENLDSKQLNIGVWGGDVVLKDLVLKQSALDDLNLPVKTVFGRMGKLTLKIPWKDPYNSPIEASVDGLYLLSKPNEEVKYDPVKEEKYNLQNKQAKLQSIADAKLKEAEKDKPKADPGFTEKLYAQIVKNLQIYIKNIHIRYEDHVTHAGHPFAAGFTLGSLIMVTTDRDWVPGIAKDIKKIYKILNMEGLAVYWNCGPTSYDQLDNERKVELFQKEVATKLVTPENYRYILGPINSSARLVLNQKPEIEQPAFSSPKVHVNLEMEKLAIGISKFQYQGIMALFDSMDRMNKARPYRKYRPCVPYKKHYKEWWHFAYKCIIEEEVKRKRNAWDWNYILNHRKKCRTYEEVYQTKLQNKKISTEIQTKLDNLEVDLDLVNLVILRQKVELEVERIGLKQQQQSRSWFSWWSSAPEPGVKESNEILKQFENAMTPAEKQRLYKAIDYNENAVPQEYPETYVDTACKFILHLLEIEIQNDVLPTPLVLTAALNEVKCQVSMRAGASAMKVVVNVDKLNVEGLMQDIGIPTLVSSGSGEESSLLSIMFETNPLDKKCSQRLQLKSKPLKIIYDAATINNAVEIFKLPESSALEQLSEATANSLNNVRQMTATGLQYTIEQHTTLELNIDLHAPYIIIPYGGKYTENENVLVVNLGRLRVSTGNKQQTGDLRSMYAAGTDEKEILNQLIEQSYEKFILQFTDLQIVLAQSDENWQTSLKQSKKTVLHILNPLSVNVTFLKCLITDDPRLPIIKIRGQMPSISLNIINSRLILLLSLINSIPFPKRDYVEPHMVTKANSSLTLVKDLQELDKDGTGDVQRNVPDNLVQMTSMDMQFILNELSVVLVDKEFASSQPIEIASFKIKSLEVEMIQQTYNIKVNVRLKSIDMNQYMPKPINVISTPTAEKQNQYLINITYSQVDKKSPNFHSEHQSCESHLSLHFTILNVLLHQEGLQSIMRYATDLQSEIDEIQSKSLKELDNTSSKSINLKRTLSTVSESMLVEYRKKTKKTKKGVIDTIKFKLQAKLDEVSVKFANQNIDISLMAIKGLVADVIIKQAYTEVKARLINITVVDLNKENIHNNILSVLGEEALNAQIVLFNEEYAEPESLDMSVRVNMGQMRIIFINWFISNMMEFMNQFQAAQQKIIQASQAAAEQAKINMQEAYKKATRISLNIDIKAPDIIVPANSKSLDAILLDLGHITLTNSFNDMKIKNEVGHSAVVDEIKMMLQDFKLARIKLKTSKEIETERSLLKPLTFTLYLKRNLTTSWYTAIPDIDVMVRMGELNLTMGQLDYKTIMGVLSGNLAEGQVTKKEAAPSSSQTSRPSNLTNVSVQSAKPEDEVKTVDNVHIFLKFNFRMDKFVIQIFVADEEDENIYNGLGTFCLEGFSLKGRILTDNLIITSILLVNCIIEDNRKGREGKLNRLMERKSDSEERFDLNESTESIQNVKSMIDLVYQQKGHDTFVDLKVYSFNLILSMDFLMKVSDFFTKALPTAPDQKQPMHSKSMKSIQTKSLSSTSSGDVPANMTVNMKIEQPDIILVEHIDNIDANALILNSEIFVKFRTNGKNQSISGSIKDFEMYTSCYNPIRRADTKRPVLHPINITIAGSTPENAGLHIEISVTQVRISVSPATIELINRCKATVVGYNAQEVKIVQKKEHLNLWDSKPFNEQDYWFLKTETAEEAEEFSLGDTTILSSDATKMREACVVQIPSIILTLETGTGSKPLPMLLLESGFEVNISNWSSQLSVDAILTLQMGYYNNRLALWEPLIEPVQITKDKKITYKPWELKLEVSMTETDVGSPINEEVDSDLQINSAAMSIDISSKNTLELTVTKTCIEVINSLMKTFASAMKIEGPRVVEHIAPYKVVNESGLPVTLILNKGKFCMHENVNSENVLLETGAVVNLQLKNREEAHDTLQLGTEMEAINKSEEYFIHVLINDYNCELELPIARADTRYFSLKGAQKDRGIICQIDVFGGIRIITLRSILQVVNSFNIAIDVYYMTAKGNELEYIATVRPHASLNIPYNAVYSQTFEIFFSVDGFSVTRIPYIWKDLQSNIVVSKLLYCESKNRHICQDSFILKAVGEIRQVFFENTTRYTMISTCYNIRLSPAVFFKNSLPFDIICCFETTIQEYRVKPGELCALPYVDPGKSLFVIRIPEYLEKEWSCTVDVPENPQLFSVWTFDSNDSAAKMSLDLGIHALNKNGSWTLSLYCPFWMLNKTGHMLAYKKSKKTEKREAAGSPFNKGSDENLNILHHPPDFKGPILFSFNAKNFFGKKKASIRIERGEWSDKFSLDVAGSCGVVVCKNNNAIYQVGVHNKLTYNGLTKQVTFTAYFVLMNNAPFDLEFQEMDRPADAWFKVESNSCKALWPKSERDDKLLKLRIYDTEEVSAPFLITESHTSLLKLKNNYGGVNVDIQMTEAAIYINLTNYDLGMAPALIINHTKNTLSFWEKESINIRKLKPQHRLLYTWDNPSGPRLLIWDIGNNQDMEDELRKDGVGEFLPKENEPIYWVSFLNGMQRVLLFTPCRSIAEEAQSAGKFDIIQQELTVSIHGIGISLVNNETRSEIMYLAIASSGIIWEQCKLKSKRFKQMSTKDNINVENSYQMYLAKKNLQEDDNGHMFIDSKTEVDFISNVMLKPHKRLIRRMFQTGLWIQGKTGPNQMQIHAKINRIQIDNQMYDAIFPVVLAPVPPPKSVSVLNAHKPFAELSIVQLLIKNTQIRQFKYFKVLIQEFHIKVDLGFMTAVMEVMQTSEPTDKEEQEQFLKDVRLVDEPLFEHAATQSQQEQKSFYDLLHLSPLKIHVSFTLASGSGGSQGVNTPNFLNVLLQGLGVTLTDLQDVIFKLGYFERNYTFLTQKQLVNEAISHYVGQSVKQLYVLVLGLDVIGNPYGLVMGFTKGVEDFFYEPIQGAIQGPGEFAEGLVLGVRSLFGHTVGGAAGAVSRITGAMGKGIAVLTFDKDYQRKRRDQLNKKPATVQEGFARGGKGLVMGVVDGVTGVFTKPITGAKEQGVGGFFKGLGKGAVGLVTRPTAGVIDFTSGSLDAVKRATEMSEEITKMRPSRFCQADGLVRPYNLKESEGNKLLLELEKGKFATTDIYAQHYIIIEKKEILMLTDKRMAYIVHNDIFGGWQVEWSYTWQDMKTPATVNAKGVCISGSDIRVKKKMGLFGHADSGKLILLNDPNIREDVRNKIEELRNRVAYFT